MASPAPVRRNNKDLIFLSLLLAVGITVFELWMATTTHPNIRDQHLGGAVAYAKGHIDLLRPMILGFAMNGAPTPLEFPLWQASTAVLMKCFGIWYGWGNVVSLVFFFSSLWPLFHLCSRIGSPRVGWWAVVFTLFQPMSWLEGGKAAADSSSWAFAVWFIYASYRMMNEGKWSWWVVAVCFGVLSAVTKAPFFMTVGLTTFFWLLLHYCRSMRAWLFLASAGAISFLFFLIWNIHCHHVYAEADFTPMNLDPFIKNSDVHKWYFGDMAFRLNLGNWLHGIWHLGSIVLDGFTFVALMLIASRFKKSIEPWLWIFAAAITWLVFPILIIEHLQYFFIFASAVAWLCAISTAEIETGLWERLRIPLVGRIGILLTAFAAPFMCALMLLHVTANYFDSYVEEVGQIVKQHTAPDEKIVVSGLHWGQLFLQADRQGYNGGITGSVDETEWLNDPKKLDRLKQLGYTKLVLVNPSPIVVALTASTPHVKRRAGGDVVKVSDLHEALPTVGKNWPVVYDSPQVLIVQIPNSQTAN